jgi:hypothetical protein
VEFEPIIPASEQQQTYTLDCRVTGISLINSYRGKRNFIYSVLLYIAISRNVSPILNKDIFMYVVLLYLAIFRNVSPILNKDIL